MLRAKLKETKTAMAKILENREGWSEATFTTGKSLLCAIGPLFLFTFDPFFQQFVSWHVLWARRNRGDLVLRFFPILHFFLCQKNCRSHITCAPCVNLSRDLFNVTTCPWLRRNTLLFWTNEENSPSPNWTAVQWAYSPVLHWNKVPKLLIRLGLLPNSWKWCFFSVVR